MTEQNNAPSANNNIYVDQGPAVADNNDCSMEFPQNNEDIHRVQSQPQRNENDRIYEHSSHRQRSSTFGYAPEDLENPNAVLARTSQSHSNREPSSAETVNREASSGQQSPDQLREAVASLR